MRDEDTKTAAIFVSDQDGLAGEVASFDPVDEDVERLREELRSERDQFSRLAAEFDNYRRRVRQERLEAADSGKQELLLQLITFADDFERAVENLDDNADQVAEGLHVIRRRLNDVLRLNGVIPFESKGERFDPERHEAFHVVTTGENDSGTVESEFRRGYFWNNKLLRPALVVVEK
ncbi:MAG: nucleotide exchange factor GrpE [Acidobacteriota bacterium]